jgi:hypothetical protein
MMDKRFYIAFAIAAVIAATAWAEPDVYVLGTEKVAGVNIACYWKNGERVVLPSKTPDVEVRGIVLSGKDVYVAGNDGGVCYWKNGKKTMLSDNSKHFWSNWLGMSGITVSGKDVYVADGDVWKNGKKIIACGFSRKKLGTFYRIAVSGKDIHMLSSESPGGADPYPFVYWKNKTRVEFLDQDYLHKDYLVDISVSGEDVYLVGCRYRRRYGSDDYGDKACYWKNGEINMLPSNGESRGLDIFISGNDVYVAGGELNMGENYKYVYMPYYWKNGEKVSLPLGDNVKMSCRAAAIAVAGNDVYVVGTGYAEENSEIFYWVNGKRVLLSGRHIRGEAVDIILGDAQ